MPELSLFKDFTPGAYGIWALVIMGIIYGWREFRETRKLSSSDRQARREGYERQVQLLMSENRSLHSDLATLRREYDEYRQLCHAENDSLRELVVKAENDLAGLRRRIDTQAMKIAELSGVPALPPPEENRR